MADACALPVTGGRRDENDDENADRLQRGKAGDRWIYHYIRYRGPCAGTHCIYEDRYLRLAMRLMQQARERDCYTSILTHAPQDRRRLKGKGVESCVACLVTASRIGCSDERSEVGKCPAVDLRVRRHGGDLSI